MSPPEPRPSCILIVDDEPDILESLSDLFGAGIPDLKVQTALSGAEGLKQLASGPVDLILSDYKMPGMNGLQFLEEARRVAPQVPRIMMTAFPDLEIAIRAINEARITTFFTKPLDPQKTIDGVKSALDARRSQAARDQAFSRVIDQLRRAKSASGAPPAAPKEGAR